MSREVESIRRELSPARRAEILRARRAAPANRPPPQPIGPGIDPDQSRREKAEAIWRFLEGAYKDIQELDVHVNPARVIQYLDALKSSYFMDLVEDSNLPYDFKIDLSQMVSGLNKLWSNIEGSVWGPRSQRVAALLYILMHTFEDVCGALDIRIAEKGEGQELPQPETTWAPEDPDGTRDQPN